MHVSTKKNKKKIRKANNSFLLSVRQMAYKLQDCITMNRTQKRKRKEKKKEKVWSILPYNSYGNNVLYISGYFETEITFEVNIF